MESVRVGDIVPQTIEKHKDQSFYIDSVQRFVMTMKTLLLAVWLFAVVAVKDFTGYFGRAHKSSSW